MQFNRTPYKPVACLSKKIVYDNASEWSFKFEGHILVSSYRVSLKHLAVLGLFYTKKSMNFLAASFYSCRHIAERLALIYLKAENGEEVVF